MITLYCIQPKGFNVGNDAIHLALRHVLYEAFGRVVNIISLPATSRYESQAKAGLTARTIHEINQLGHGVIVGGGNLYENGELDVNLDALKALEPPLMLFSLSRGRVYNRRDQLVPRTDAMPDRIMKALNDRADFSLARDDATLAHLRSIGCDRAELGGCPTVYLDRVADRLPPIPKEDRDLTLVSIRNPTLMNISPKRQAGVYDQVERTVQFLREQGHERVRLLCHDVRDIAFATTFPNVEYIYTGDVYAYLALLRWCRLAVSFRLHATLPAISFGRPCINISYDERASSVMHSLGLGSWNIEMVGKADLNEQIIDRFRRLDDLAAIRQRATTVWQDLYRKNMTTLGKFAAMIVERENSEAAA